MRLEDPRDLDTRVRALRCELAGDRVILAGIRVLLALERCAHFDPAQPRDELGRWAEIGRSTTYPITDPNAETDPAPKDERIRVPGRSTGGRSICGGMGTSSVVIPSNGMSASLTMSWQRWPWST